MKPAIQAIAPIHAFIGDLVMMHRYIAHPALALGSTLLWGAIELLALLRSRWTEPGRPYRN